MAIETERQETFMKRRRERRMRSGLMDLQREVHPERLARMLLAGMSVYTIAKKLNVSIGQSAITSKKNPSSQFFLRVKKELFSRIDPKLAAMLPGDVTRPAQE